MLILGKLYVLTQAAMIRRATIFVSAAVAISSVSLIVMVQRRALSDSERSTRAEMALALLDRRVGSITYNGDAAADAVAKIEEQSGMKISVQWAPAGESGVMPATKVRFDLKDVSLGQALDALVDAMNESVSQPDRLMTYVLRDSTIMIAPAHDMPHQTRVYDVRDIAACNPGCAEQPVADLAAPLIAFGWWDKSMNGCGEPAPGWLAVSQSPQNHARINRYLHALRAAQPDGNGPSLLIAYCWGGRSTRMVMRFYDVREIAEKLQWSWRVRMEVIAEAAELNWDCGTDAVQQAVIFDAIGFRTEYASFGTRVFSAHGRLVVCGTPDEQEKVGEYLENLRSHGDRFTKGLRLKPTTRP